MELYLVPAVSVACVVAGLWILKLAVGWRKKAIESEGWPSAPGKILKSKLHLSNAARTSIGPDVSVTYEYFIDSQRYTNEKVAFYEVTTSEEAAALYERFSSGVEVDVFYNPQDYGESVLVRGRRPEKRFHEFAMGAIVAIVGVFLAIVHREKFESIIAVFW